MFTNPGSGLGHPTRRRLVGSSFVFCAATFAHAIGDGKDLLPDIPSSAVTVQLEVVANLGSRVIDIASAGDGSGRLFLVQPQGIVRILKNGVLLAQPFLVAPATPADRAMSSLAFHPDYATNGKLYVITGEPSANPPTADYFPPQVDSASAFDNVLVEYRVDAVDPDRVDPSSKREVLRIHRPHQLHTLDDLAFGPDGYLYITSGDGGDTGTGSPTHYNTNAQLTTNVFGKILRIDVDHIGPNGRYAIPPDNPFAGGTGGNVPEIYSFGLRNPWRISADRLTGELYVGDNGDFTIEWVIRVERGKNHGWDPKEGSFLWDPLTRDASVDPNPDPQYTPPLAEWDHNNSDDAYGSVISGYVYRGSRVPALYGKLLTLDWVAGSLIAVEPATGALELVHVSPTGEQLAESQHITWGEDDGGEPYIGSSNGKVLRFVPTQAGDFAGRVPDDTGFTVAKGQAGTIVLSWGASCQSDDGDYAVYVGTLGDFASHAAVLCSTGGATTAALAPGGGNTYYLVAPLDGLREGSLGTDSQGFERPQAVKPCLLRAVGPCD